MVQYIIPAVIGLVGVIAGALITNAFQRQKIKSATALDEAAINEKIRLTCVGLIDPLKEQINSLERQLKAWKDYAGRLRNQLIQHGHVPVPFEEPNDGS